MTFQESSNRDVAAPHTSRWSLKALHATFAKSLHGWFRRFGVRPTDMEDATQEVLLGAWQELSTIPNDAAGARCAMFRIAATVARRWYRNAQKPLLYQADVDCADAVDEEAWIAARMRWVEAMNKLDPASRDLIVAHTLEGRTFEVIGIELKQSADTVRKRFSVAHQRLLNELDRLLDKPKKRHRSSAAVLAVGFGFTPFDRAVLRAVVEVEGDTRHIAVASKVAQFKATSSAIFNGLPMGVLMGALVMAPGDTPNVCPLHAQSFTDGLLSRLSLPAVSPVEKHPEPQPQVPEVVPPVRPAAMPKPVVPARKPKPLPKLDAKTKAALRGVITKSSR